MATKEPGRIKTATVPVPQTPKANPNYEAPSATVRTDRSRLRMTEAGQSKAQSATVLAWEEKNRNYKTEHAAIVGPDGTLNPNGDPYMGGGKTRARIYTPALVKDGILLHNHPSDGDDLAGRVGVPLSGQDLYLAARYDLKEVRSVTKGYVYSIKRPANGWPSAYRLRSDMDTAWEAAIMTGRSLGRQRLASGLITSMADANTFNNRYNVAAQAKIIRDIAKKYGLSYTRRKSSK